jgi:hypothetical protein
VAVDLASDHRGSADSVEVEKGDTMTHDVRMWLVILAALFGGLILFANSKDKWATIGGYVFLCGFFLALWILAFGGVPIR